MLYALLRHVDFRGKGRLRRVLPVPNHGERVVRFRGGLRLRLDLREQIQRDWYCGLYDGRELQIVRRAVANGGDFVDIGAHAGMYAITAARAGAARVLALEPNPRARAQLEANLALNHCSNVVVRPAAAADRAGSAELHVPASDDPSFSSLAGGRFAEAEPVAVELTTVDAEVERLSLAPAAVKIDVEGEELGVLAGMERTLAQYRPLVLCEVGPETAEAVEARLKRLSYRAEHLGRGLHNAVFVPAG